MISSIASFVSYLARLVGKPVLIAVLINVALNYKSLPFAWSIRIARGYYGHYWMDRRPGPRATLPESSPDSATPILTLFQPTIYTTTTPPGDVDFYLHKSNSTYLADLDVARGYHVFSIFREGFRRGGHAGGGQPGPALAGTACIYRRPIAPLARVEIWTRLLAWDAKWIYLVSHFVQPGSVRPGRYADQPWRNKKVSAGRKREGDRDVLRAAQAEGEVNAAICATCISKYVLKQGRKTVSPYEFLQVAGLLPVAPTAAAGTEAQAGGLRSRFPAGEGNTGSRGDGQVREILVRIEERRLKGLALADHMAALDAGHQWFDAPEEEVGDNGPVVFAKY